MKLLCRILFFLLFVCFSFVKSALAQNISLSGQVFSPDENAGLSFARIALICEGDSLPKVAAEADETGRFSQLNSPCRRFVLRVQALQYQDFQQDYDFDSLQVPVDASSFDLGQLKIYPDATTLETVNVEAQRMQVNLSGDTITFAASAFGVHQDANVQDLLNRIPGLELRGDEIYMNGVKIEQILVDGKAYFGEDALKMLAYLPSKTVDKIIIQEDKNAVQKDLTAATPVLQLNIVRKKEYQTGVSGSATAAYGTDERYRFDGMMELSGKRRRITVTGEAHNISQTPENLRRGYYVQPGIHETSSIRVNGNDSIGKTTSVQLGLRYTYMDSYEEDRLERQYFLNDGGIQRQSVLKTNPNFSNSIGISGEIESRFDSLTRMEISIWGRFSENQNRLKNQTLFRGVEGNLLSQSLNRSEDQTTDYYAYAELEFTRRWAGSQRRIEVYSNFYPRGDSDEGQFSAENAFLDDSLWIRQNQAFDKKANNTDNYIYNRLRYIEPIGKKVEAQVGYSFAPKWMRNDSRTTAAISGELDSLRSSFYKMTQFAHTAITGLTWKPKWGEAEMLMQYSWVEWSGRQTLPNFEPLDQSWRLFRPLIRLRYNLKPKGFVEIRYDISPSTPDINELSGQLNFSDPLVLRVGNPRLSPYASHNFRIRFDWVNPKTEHSFNMWSYSTYQPNSVVNSTYTSGTFLVGDSLLRLEPGQQLLRVEQRPYSLNTWAQGTYSFPVKKLKSTFSIMAYVAYNSTANYIDNRSNQSTGYSINMGPKWISNFGDKLSASLRYWPTYKRYGQNGIGGMGGLQENWVHSLTPQLDWTFSPAWKLSTDFDYTYNNNLAPGISPTRALWNASVSRKLFREFQGEIGLWCFDLLDQNLPADRTTEGNFLEDRQALVLSRYFQIWFRYRWAGGRA